MTEKECRQGKCVNYQEARKFIIDSKDILTKYNISYNNTLNTLNNFSNKWDWTLANMYIHLNNNNKIELYTGIVYGDKTYIL